MALEERETVVVQGDRDRSSSWVIGVILLVLLLMAFFYFGGFGLFGGNTTTNETDTINVDTPERVNIQPNESTARPDAGSSTNP